MSASLTIGIVVMILVIIVYAWLHYSHYNGAEGVNKEAGALNSIELASLDAYLEGNARTIPGGGCMDDFFAFIRNKHELVSMFAPMRFSPISRHERLMCLNFQFGLSYMITACLEQGGNTGYGYILGCVTIPVGILALILEYLASRDAKKLNDLKKNKVDIKELSEVKEAKENNVRIKLKTGVSDEYYLNQTSSEKCASCGQYVCLIIACVCWIIGFAVSASLESEEGFIGVWLVGLLQSYGYWFIYQPFIFCFKYCREEPFHFHEDQGTGCDAKTAELAKKMERIEPLSNEAIQEHLTSWADATCCYSSGPIDSLEISGCNGMPSYYYKFSSFGETRNKKSEHKPYHPGQPVDNQGAEPPLWEVNCPPDQDWKEHEKCVKVPHSEEVKQCHVCHGTGKVKCTRCGGKGTITVTREGNTSQQRCSSCGGSGEKKDPTCDGTGQLLWYKLLVAFFGAPSLDFIAEFSDLPDFLIKGEKGKEILNVEEKLCGPVALEQSPMLINKSKDFIQKHKTELGDDDRIRILKQKHTVTMIPIWECLLKNGDVTEVQVDDAEKAELNKDLFAHKFFIYGNDHRVYFPAYPAKCYCGNCMDGANCAIM